MEATSKEIAQVTKIAIEAKIEAVEARKEVAEAIDHFNTISINTIMRMSDGDEEEQNENNNNRRETTTTTTTTTYDQQEIYDYDYPPPTLNVSSQQAKKSMFIKNADASNTNSLDPPSSSSSPKENDGDDKFQTNISSDTFTLMMISKPFHKSWNFGFAIFLIQIALLSLIFSSGGGFLSGGTFSDTIPFKVPSETRASQFIAIFITIMISHDIFMPIKDLTLLWIDRREWSKVVQGIHSGSYYRSMRNFDTEDAADGGLWGRPVEGTRRRTWLLHILLPSMLKFLQGIFVLIITFVIVIQSDNTLDLFKDFAAMQVISELDNVAFYLCNHGYFGSALKRDSDTSKEIKIVDRVPKICGLPLRPVVLFSLYLLMNGIFLGSVVMRQMDGTVFSIQYPNCDIEVDQILKINDGQCNNGLPNTFQCGFDGGGELDD